MMNYYFEPTEHKTWMADGAQLDVWLENWDYSLKLICREAKPQVPPLPLAGLHYHHYIYDDPIGEEAFMAIPDAVQKKAQALAKEEFAAKLAEYPPVNWRADSDGRSWADVFCPKCGVGRATTVYHEDTDHSPEHLLWKCGGCGFYWCSKPVDAA